MNDDRNHDAEMDRLSLFVETDPVLRELLRKARLELQRAPSKQHRRLTLAANVIKFPAERIVRIHPNTVPRR